MNFLSREFAGAVGARSRSRIFAQVLRGRLVEPGLDGATVAVEPEEQATS